MCKIFAMTSMKHVKITEDFITAVQDAVCRTGDDDGFGYAVSTVDGRLWGERTLEPFMFAPLHPVTGTKTQALPIVSVSSNSFGPVGHDDNLAFVGHGRMSTNHVTIENTHPFVGKSVALIHNGVVSDPNKAAGSLKTTCDTEILLNLWEKGGMDAIETHSAGYYALAILDTSGKLHLAKDDRAKLVCAWSETVQSFLFATNDGIIQDVAARMGWVVENSEPVRDNVYAVFEGNEVTFQRDISPLGYPTGYNNALINKAFGGVPLHPVGGYPENDFTSDDKYLEWEGITDSDLESDDAPSDEIDYDDVLALIEKRRASSG